MTNAVTKVAAFALLITVVILTSCSPGADTEVSIPLEGEISLVYTGRTEWTARDGSSSFRVYYYHDEERCVGMWFSGDQIFVLPDSAYLPDCEVCPDD